MRPCFLAIACFVLSCGGSDLTVDVGIDIESCVADRMSRLEVRVQNADGSLRETFTEDDPVFPTGVQLTSGEAATGWRIEAEAFDANGVSLGLVRARGDFEAPNVERVFHNECNAVVCGEDETCEVGECVGSELLASQPAGTPGVCPTWTFVATGGATSNCGTFDMPCDSPSTIIEAGVPSSGVIINVRGESTYAPFSVPNDVTGPVTIRAWPGTGRPTFDGENMARDTLDVFASDVTLQGLRVIRGREHGIHVNFRDLLTNVKILDCILEDNGSDSMPPMLDYNDNAGVSFNNQVSDFLIEDCVFRNNRGGAPTYGAYINKTSDGVIRDSHFEGNETAGLNLRESDNVLVAGNTFLSNGESGVLLEDGDVTLENNRICGHLEGVQIAPTNVVRLVRNSIADNDVGVGLRATGVLHLDGNIVAFASDVGVQVHGGGTVEDGANLYFEAGTATSGFTPSAPDDDLVSDPAFVSRDDCSLERSAETPEGFGAE